MRGDKLNVQRLILAERVRMLDVSRNTIDGEAELRIRVDSHIHNSIVLTSGHIVLHSEDVVATVHNIVVGLDINAIGVRAARIGTRSIPAVGEVGIVASVNSRSAELDVRIIETVVEMITAVTLVVTNRDNRSAAVGRVDRNLFDLLTSGDSVFHIHRVEAVLQTGEDRIVGVGGTVEAVSEDSVRIRAGRIDNDDGTITVNRVTSVVRSGPRRDRLPQRCNHQQYNPSQYRQPRRGNDQQRANT